MVTLWAGSVGSSQAGSSAETGQGSSGSHLHPG